MSALQLAFTSSLIVHPFELEAMKGVEPLSFGLQDRRSVIQLSYIAEFGGLGGVQTLTRSLQDFYAIGYITSPRHFSFVIYSSVHAALIE
jgi:hypothetical protein